MTVNEIAAFWLNRRVRKVANPAQTGTIIDFGLNFMVVRWDKEGDAVYDSVSGHELEFAP